MPFTTSGYSYILDDHFGDSLTLCMPRKCPVVMQQQSPRDGIASNEEPLRMQRIKSYLDDKVSYGSRLVALPDRPVSTSPNNISKEAESEMAIQITDIMKPFHNNDEKHKWESFELITHWYGAEQDFGVCYFAWANLYLYTSLLSDLCILNTSVAYSQCSRKSIRSTLWIFPLKSCSSPILSCSWLCLSFFPLPSYLDLLYVRWKASCVHWVVRVSMFAEYVPN